MEYCEKQKQKKEIRALVYENNQSEDTSTTSGPLISVLILVLTSSAPVWWCPSCYLGKSSLFVLILNNDRHWCLVNNRSKLHCICIDILGFRFKDEDEWSRSRCHRGRLPLLVNMEENSCLVLDSGFSVGYFSLKESTDTLVVRFSGLAISLKKS